LEGHLVTDPIRIPDDLKPVDGRFGSGPSKVRPEGVEALARVATSYLGTSHRQQTVKEQVARLRAGIAEFFAAPDGYEVVISNGGTSAFWETATFGLIRDKAQFAEFGEFFHLVMEGFDRLLTRIGPTCTACGVGTGQFRPVQGLLGKSGHGRTFSPEGLGRWTNPDSRARIGSSARRILAVSARKSWRKPRR